ncbi:MAG: hypothetical protein WCK35_23910 [Chloroflexota bacterium]
MFDLFDYFELTVLILVLVAVKKPRTYCELAVKKRLFTSKIKASEINLACYNVGLLFYGFGAGRKSKKKKFVTARGLDWLENHTE